MGNSLTFLWMLLQTVLALAFVCGIAYLIFRVILPRLTTNYGGNSMIRIVDRAGLEARKTLYVIEVAGKWLLVSTSEAGVQMISDLDPEIAKEMEAAKIAGSESPRLTMANGKSFAERLEELMGRKGGER
jgi:flagellar biogenesis protein FliO